MPASPLEPDRPGPLDGIRVLDFSRVLAGPHCSRMLVDLGAEVIKVEPPEGDLTRFALPRVGSLSTYFAQQNCGKVNISLDLRRPEAVSVLRRLAREVDVVLENFRPGVMARMGLGYETLAADNPRIVYASISGFGQEGPWADRRAYAGVVQAECGLTAAEAHAHGTAPRNAAWSHGDLYTSLEALAGILAALYDRERTGQGQRVEVSMAETLLSVNEHLHWELHRAAGGELGDGVPSFAPGEHPVVETADGRQVLIAGHPAARGTFERYCRAMGRTDLLADPRLADVAGRRAHLEVLLEAVREYAAAHDVRAVDADFAAEGLAVGVVRDAPEVAGTEWAEARGAIVAVDAGDGTTVRIPRSPWRFSARETGVRGTPAYRGEHNRDVLGRLGIGDDELDRLEADGVLSARRPR